MLLCLTKEQNTSYDEQRPPSSTEEQCYNVIDKWYSYEHCPHDKGHPRPESHWQIKLNSILRWESVVLQVEIKYLILKGTDKLTGELNSVHTNKKCKPYN